MSSWALFVIDAGGAAPLLHAVAAAGIAVGVVAAAVLLVASALFKRRVVHFSFPSAAAFGRGRRGRRGGATQMPGYGQQTTLVVTVSPRREERGIRGFVYHAEPCIMSVGDGSA